MKIQKIENSTSFKAVNQKYVELAKKQISSTGMPNLDLFQSISYDVFKHKKMHYRDAIDTLKAIKSINADIGDAGEALLTTLFKNKPQFKVEK